MFPLISVIDCLHGLPFCQWKGGGECRCRVSFWLYFKKGSKVITIVTVMDVFCFSWTNRVDRNGRVFTYLLCVPAGDRCCEQLIHSLSINICGMDHLNSTASEWTLSEMLQLLFPLAPPELFHGDNWPSVRLWEKQAWNLRSSRMFPPTSCLNSQHLHGGSSPGE